MWRLSGGGITVLCGAREKTDSEFLSTSYTGSLAHRGSVSRRLSDLRVTKHLLPAFRQAGREVWGGIAVKQLQSCCAWQRAASQETELCVCVRWQCKTGVEQSGAKVRWFCHLRKITNLLSFTHLMPSEWCSDLVLLFPIVRPDWLLLLGAGNKKNVQDLKYPLWCICRPHGPMVHSAHL